MSQIRIYAVSANKLLNARFWPQDLDAPLGRAWAKCLKENDYEVLIVSQFTLYGIFKGNKPDFHHSMPPQEARVVYDNFVKKVKQLYKADKVQEGEFGAMMEVALVNDGPVTMHLDSRKWAYVDEEQKPAKPIQQKEEKPGPTDPETKC